jgi:hypothetical protein
MVVRLFWLAQYWRSLWEGVLPELLLEMIWMCWNPSAAKRSWVLWADLASWMQDGHVNELNTSVVWWPQNE